MSNQIDKSPSSAVFSYEEKTILKQRVKELESENKSLKEEIEILKKERVEKCNLAFEAGRNYEYDVENRPFPARELNWEEWKLKNLGDKTL